MSAHCCHHHAPSEPDPRYRRVLWTVLAINAAGFLVEMAAGLAAGSASLQADALDFLGDAANYAISLSVFGLALRWRATAALIKGASMGVFGLWVIGSTAWYAMFAAVPRAEVMGAVGLLALAANVLCLVLLMGFRSGDSNMRSVWLCSRNDVIGNIAVLVAASGVLATDTGWPDLGVAAVMATLAISTSVQVIRQARAELRARHTLDTKASGNIGHSTSEKRAISGAR
ncbi:MAG: cation transporter [Methylocystis sp.]